MDWTVLNDSRVQRERRNFRIIRLAQDRKFRHMRLKIDAVQGEFPTVREIEFIARKDQAVPFGDWIVMVNTTHESKLPNHGQEFLPLAKSSAPNSQLEAQQLWLDAFDPEFLEVEPKPLAAFLSGNFKDWCEVDRKVWRGAEDVLKRKVLPIWASCGGAQGLALLAEVGVDKPDFGEKPPIFSGKVHA